jgi:chromosome segregation ATPase
MHVAQQPLDPAPGTATLPAMFRRLISGAMRSSVEELLSKPLQELVESQKIIVAEQRRLGERIDGVASQLNQRIDGVAGQLNQRIDGLSERFDGLSERFDGLSERIDGLSERIDGLSARVDGLSAQVGGLRGEVSEMRGEVAGMKVEVASLKRDRDSADDLVHRVTRIEDRLFSGSN